MDERFPEEQQKVKLGLLRRKEEEEATQFLATKYGLPYLNLTTIPIDPEALKIIAESEAKKALLAVISKRGKFLDVVVVKPKQEDTLRLTQGLEEKGFKIKLFLVSRSSLDKIWDFYKGIVPEGKRSGNFIEVDPTRMTFFQERSKELGALKEYLKKIPQGETSAVVELLLIGGLQL